MNQPNALSSILNLDQPSPSQSSSSRPSPRDRNAAAKSIFDKMRASHTPNEAPMGERKVEGELRGKNVAEDYMRQMPRRWKLGDVYAPRDLSSSEMRKWGGISNVERDLVDLMGLQPLDMYRVSLSEE